MSLKRLGAGLIFAVALGACESLPVSLPGQGAEPPQPVVSQPAPPVETVEREDPQNGVAGASLCIASAFYLADAELMSEEQALSAAEVWTGILDVIPSEPQARQQAVNDAYGALEGLDQRTEEGGLQTAIDQYSENGTCVDQQFQRDFLLRFGDPALMEQQLGGGS
ncbi:MAG: hypothetical protein AAF216_11325 [Pseudomonadota bacterium]